MCLDQQHRSAARHEADIHSKSTIPSIGCSVVSSLAHWNHATRSQSKCEQNGEGTKNSTHLEGLQVLVGFGRGDALAGGQNIGLHASIQRRACEARKSTLPDETAGIIDDVKVTHRGQRSRRGGAR